MRSWVIALGGNALLPPGESGDLAAMQRRIRESAAVLAGVADGTVALVVTHGNGTQVGHLLAQVEEARGKAPSAPLDVLVAETQAQIGYLLQQAIQNEFAKAKRATGVVTVITQVVVDGNDPDFEKPSKPVGPIIATETEAMLKRARGWILAADARGGWRRIVPSPRPRQIVETSAIQALLAAGHVVIAAGGGGVPVVRKGDSLVGVEAVVDKDLASALLAREIGAERLVLATDVDRVALDFRKPNQRFVDHMTIHEAREHLKAGQFPTGSMGPKVEAAIGFLEGGGKESIITSLGRLREALDGTAGTRISK
ncbi:MAG TPA: carbamate kinase [Thermoplasmata archaeon]|nr:carbamate kinase [Thermoplasmata archaeon]